MTNDEKIVCKEFETEVYLYLDNDLPDDRINFWKDHLEKCKTCTHSLDDVQLISKTASEKLSEDILDARFDKMIERAVSKRNQY